MVIMPPAPSNKTQKSYSVKAVAKLLGLDERRVQQLTKDGVIPAALSPRGYVYDLPPAVQGYIAYLKSSARSGGNSAREHELKQQKMEVEIALKESQNENQRLKMDITAGKYISVEEVALDYARFFVAFKKFALALPGRLVSQLGGAVESLEARRIEKELTADVTRSLRGFVISGAEEGGSLE